MPATAQALQIDHSRAVVNRLDIAPDDQSGEPRQRQAFAIAALTGRRPGIVAPEGCESHAGLHRGAPCFRPGGGSDTVVNGPDAPRALFEIELTQ